MVCWLENNGKFSKKIEKRREQGGERKRINWEEKIGKDKSIEKILQKKKRGEMRIKGNSSRKIEKRGERKRGERKRINWEKKIGEGKSIEKIYTGEKKKREMRIMGNSSKR